jgi:hypothetical protein
MNKPAVDAGRRRMLLGAATALASLPLLSLVSDACAAAAALPHLAEDDPTAKALKYHNDATEAPRTERNGIAPDEQFCRKCQFIQADSGDWRPCSIFPGKAVNANGWCSSWMPRPG